MFSFFQLLFRPAGKRVALLSAMLVLLAAGLAHAGIEVFTIAGQPVVNIPDGAVVVELDAPARLDAQLSAGLPEQRDAARAEMHMRMNSPEWKSLLQQYGQAATGVARAWMIGVEKVPAVVVDGRYVVYGEADVSRALVDIEAHRGATP